MTQSDEIRLSLEQIEDFQFRIRFEGAALAALETDEPEPLGRGSGPNPAQLLLAAVGNCMAASLLFALRKFKNAPGPLRATVIASRERNADGRWRIPRAEVVLHLPEAAERYRSLDRILESFEDFCVVTQSVRQGIDVRAVVEDANGLRLRARDPE
jgi:uncharacterized OsmC-like protein